MKKLRFEPKEIADLQEQLEASPFTGETAPRSAGGESILGDISIYPSQSRKKVEYRCVVRNDPEQGWMGMCSCRGWCQLKKTQGDTRPCRHIFDALRRHPNFKLQEIIGAAFEQEKARREARREKRRAAQQKRFEEAQASPKPEPLDETHGEPSEEGALVVWSSKAPLLSVCPASLPRGESSLSVRTYSSPAALGSAVHRAAEMIIKDQLDAPPDLTAQLTEAGASENEIKDYWWLSWSALREWNGAEGKAIEPLRAYFPTIYLEHKMHHRMTIEDPYTKKPQLIILTAKPDWCGPSHEVGHWIVGDWKTNRKEDEPFYQEQMKMEAAVILAQDKSIHKVTTIIVWLRHEARDIKVYTRDEIREWLQKMVQYRMFWDGKTYVSGDHCTYCQRACSCEGRKEQFRANVALLGALDPNLLLYDDRGSLLAPDLMAERLDFLKSFRKVDKAFTDQLKALLIQGGTRPLAEREGYGLGIKEGRGSLAIDPSLAWPIIMTVLTPEQVISAISIRIKDLETTVKNATKTCAVCLGTGYSDEAGLTKCESCDGVGKVEVYPRGVKGEAWDDLKKKLEESGAAKRGAPRREVAVIRLDEQESEEGENDE